MTSKLFALALVLLMSLAEAANIRVLVWDREIAERDLWIGKGEDFIKIEEMHPRKRSKAIKVSASEEGVFLLLKDRTDKEGNSAQIKLKVPAKTSDLLLLLVPDKKSSAGLKTIVLKDDLSSFPWGSTRFFNVTGKPYVFKFGEKLVRISADAKPTLMSPGGDRRKVEVGLYNPDDAKKRIYSAVWEHRPDLRKLVFIAPQEDRSLGTIEMRVIQERKVSEDQ